MDEVFIINDRKFIKILDWEVISCRIKKIANEINILYKNKEPLFIITLKGGMFFGTELLKYISLHCTVDVIKANSYGLEMSSCGNITIGDVPLNIYDKDVIIIEDIIDTGKTLSKLLEIFKKQNPKSLAIATLFSKPLAHLEKIKIDYLGFEIENNFVIGCGLDYMEYGRNLLGLYELKE